MQCPISANTHTSIEEAASHLLLASHDLAPSLLARFANGMIYRYIPGRVCTPSDLQQEAVWRGVATRLGQWHASLPITSTATVKTVVNGHVNGLSSVNEIKPSPLPSDVNAISPSKVTPNVWTIMQKWIYALPASTAPEKERQALLQKELKRTVAEFADLPGLGQDGLVFSHCDLLSGNVVIVTSSSKAAVNGTKAEDVRFIDYEYAVPAPAAFDLANHFAEWGGFDCDYNVLPTRATRRAFLADYLDSYNKNHPKEADSTKVDLDSLCSIVDQFRGLPGLYWGIWALIQATISQIDFDYATYAEIRLAEYFAWRAEEDGSRAMEGRVMPLRERRWAE